MNEPENPAAITIVPEEGALQEPKATWIDRAKAIQSGKDLNPIDFTSLMQLAQMLQKSPLLPNSLKGDLGGTVLVLAQSIQMGLPWTIGMKELYVVGNKVGVQSRLLRALVSRDPSCRMFYVEEATDKKATVVLQRVDMPGPVRITYTMEDAEKAGLAGRNPQYRMRGREMMIARATGLAANTYFPATCLGLDVEDEMTFEPLPGPRVFDVPRETSAVAAIAGGAMQGPGPMTAGDFVDGLTPEPEKEIPQFSTPEPEKAGAAGSYQPPTFFVTDSKPPLRRGRTPKAHAMAGPGGGLVDVQEPAKSEPEVSLDDAKAMIDYAGEHMGFMADGYLRQSLADVGIQNVEGLLEGIQKLSGTGYAKMLNELQFVVRKAKS